MFRRPLIKSSLNKFDTKSNIFIVDYDSGEKKKMITTFYSN